VNYDAKEICSAIRRCLFDEEFRAICSSTKNPYGGGNAGKLITESLASVNLDPKIILRKRMMLAGKQKDGWFR
jgi:UDP-N-acetylglucosamine 2-epimerase